MEDYALDVMIGKGPSARSLRLNLKPFTVVGATTRAGRISSPLRDRFGATYRLDFYDEAGPRPRSSTARPGSWTSRSTMPRARAIARRGRGTPRIVNRLLKRTRDHAQVHGDGRVDEATATAAMRQMEIDDEGLDSTDRKLLAAIIQKFALGPGRRRRPWRPSSPRRSRRSRTSTSRSSSGSGSSTARPRAGSRPRRRATTSRGSATRSRRRVVRSRRWSACGTAGRRRTARRARAAPRSGAAGDAQADAARFTVQVGPSGGRLDAGPGRPAGADPRRRRDAAVHARRHERDGQGAPSGRHPRGRRHDHPREHLPPLPAAGSRSDRAARRAPPVHGLGRADPDRLRRLPGGLARRPPGRRRRRRDVPQPPRRVDPSVHPGARDRASRRRSDRTSRSRSTSRSTRAHRAAVVADATERTHRWAERSLAAHRAPGPGAVRDRPGRARAGPSRREHASSSPALPFDGICIGGLAGDETPVQRNATLDVAVPLLAARSPAALPHGPRLARPTCSTPSTAGIDLFDSVLPARVARNGQLWVPGRPAEPPQRPLPRRSGARPGGLPVPPLPVVLAGLSGPSPARERAARLPSRDLSQPDLHPRLHGQDPHRDSGPEPSPQRCRIWPCARGRIERQRSRGAVRVNGRR